MLSAEDAGAALASIGAPDWHEAASRRIGRLRPRLRAVASAFLEPPTYDHERRDEREAAIERASVVLDECSASHRRKIMGALHPAMGDVLAEWWVAAQGTQYSSSWSRRAFRAPGWPSLSRAKRSGSLAMLVRLLGPYDRSVDWLATWAPYLSMPDLNGRLYLDNSLLGEVFAAAIDAGGAAGDEVFRSLMASADGSDPIGSMGRHVIVGLLRAGRPAGWEMIESLLLAAQRQEGLRQSILEAADEANPVAFDRLITLVLDHDLLRFAAAVRAAGVWIGFPADTAHIDQAEHRVRRLLEIRTDAAVAARCGESSDPWDWYLALCARAQEDVAPALDGAERRSSDSSPAVRAATLSFVAATGLTTAGIAGVLAQRLDDPHPDVAALALAAAAPVVANFDPVDRRPLYGPLLRLVDRLPEEASEFGAEIGVGTTVTAGRSTALTMLVQHFDDHPLDPLLAHVSSMDPVGRQLLVTAIGRAGLSDGPARSVVVGLLGDRSSMVRDRAVEVMTHWSLDPSELPAVEKLLTRRASDLRRGVIGLLAAQGPDGGIESARRLWDGTAAQRDAGAELLAVLADAAGAAGADSGTGDESGSLQRQAVADVASELLEASPTDTQREFLDSALLGGPAVDDQTLGLFAPEDLPAPTRPPRPARLTPRIDKAAAMIVDELDDLIEAYRDTPFEYRNFQGAQEVLLGDVRWLPTPWDYAVHGFAGVGGSGDSVEVAGMVLPEVFRPWWSERSAALRSDAGDGCDGLHALALARFAQHDAAAAELHQLLGDTIIPTLRHPWVVQHVLAWTLSEVVADRAQLAAVDSECRHVAEEVFGDISDESLTALAALSELGEFDWRAYSGDGRLPMFNAVTWIPVGLHVVLRDTVAAGPDAIAGWHRLLTWFDRPVIGAPRLPVPAGLLFTAHALGVASDAELLDRFTIEPGRGYHPRELQQFTARRRGRIVERFPAAVPVADALRERIVELERVRGELASPATPLVRRLASVEGADLVMDLLARLGRSVLVRDSYTSDGKSQSFSRLIQVAYPAPGDSAEVVRTAADRYGVSEQRLVELAMFAPQWAPVVEQVLSRDEPGWDGLEDAVWWFHTHTKDDRWSVELELRETWAAMAAERTPLSAADLTEGAVDVEWFTRAHERLGGDRWERLHAVAKLASGGNGHRRAQIFSDAMLGELDEAALGERISSKRHQDSVRALGLLPVDDDDEPAVQGRYVALREFERGASKFGAQRRASERLAARIGIENLARSAGYGDPQRFVWAMEAAESADLAAGPITAEVDGVAVVLSLDENGAPSIEVSRGARRLKSVPAKLKKHPELAELVDRKRSLTQQASRMRQSLEEAMVSEERFDPSDVAALFGHPVAAPMLAALLWVDDDGSLHRFDRNGAAPSGGVPSGIGSLRIAHPIDLARSGEWPHWQRQLFDESASQPFKQVFRELYALTDSERRDSPVSQRWAGHQLQPSQAAGLFTSRRWLTDHDTAEVARVFHRQNIVARVDFTNGWGTPAEVELPTISSVWFTARGERTALPLDAVSAVVFSEAMRDLDLVVSVAHAGGVDPEASASTVEMRAALVSETARVMKLDNVRIVSEHVVIAGSLGEYSVHLGSATVHRRPGGALCIIPVDAQRRGRVFLPFADDDPRSAEVVSKVLMLARDSTIKDPTILEQLRS